jgi:nucleolar protein 16
MVKRSNKPHRKRTRSELRKQRKSQHSAFRQQAEFGHPSIRAAWNTRKTLKQNYAALGLAADPNDGRQRRREAQRLGTASIDESEQEISSRMRQRQQPAADEAAEQEEDRNDSDDDSGDAAAAPPALSAAGCAVQAELEAMSALSAAGSAVPYSVRSMSVREQRRLRLLVSRHGDDVEAMARDIRVNVMQETSRQLSKRIALMRRLDSQDREGEGREEAEASSSNSSSSSRR